MCCVFLKNGLPCLRREHRYISANCQRGVYATVMLRRRLLHCRRDLAEQPLMTAASRRTRLEVEMSRYKRVIVRVQFPDRLVMQALFRTTETGRSAPLFMTVAFVQFLG